MHALKTGLNADEFATFWIFPKCFITHSFCKWPLITHSGSCWTQVDLHDFETHENVWIRVKRLFHPLYCTVEHTIQVLLLYQDHISAAYQGVVRPHVFVFVFAWSKTCFTPRWFTNRFVNINFATNSFISQAIFNKPFCVRARTPHHFLTE